MYGLRNLIVVLDDVLDTQRKRHILGGVFISASLLFAGLAFTVMTISEENEEDNYED